MSIIIYVIHKKLIVTVSQKFYKILIDQYAAYIHQSTLQSIFKKIGKRMDNNRENN